MKPGPRLARCLGPVSCLLAAVAVVLSLDWPGDFAASRSHGGNNNPDKFHLVATNGACDFSFTYDPLAADQWRFETGGFIIASPP